MWWTWGWGVRLGGYGYRREGGGVAKGVDIEEVWLDKGVGGLIRG